MFARVSTFRTGPETPPSPPEEQARKVLEMPGCRGLYFLKGKESGKSLAITLWDSEEAMTASRQAADKLRAQLSSDSKMEIVGVEEFEVTASDIPA
ncbi:antibiotic biosynthesis monooxygenase [Arthrobacter mobilis]|uniref:ABM domain-containing protein n=1 Tax=Arthrobacter mobilis TaxID=2724944 RepID=A0A7X6K5Y0_9MICC|nr:antibiotic biosynthesis monooxygenase [Arthrobacter mobilis]NKX56260.1 hypothetical protein [Arthrobacter mobilis]